MSVEDCRKRFSRNVEKLGFVVGRRYWCLSVR